MNNTYNRAEEVLKNVGMTESEWLREEVEIRTDVMMVWRGSRRRYFELQEYGNRYTEYLYGKVYPDDLKEERHAVLNFTDELFAQMFGLDFSIFMSVYSDARRPFCEDEADTPPEYSLYLRSTGDEDRMIKLDWDTASYPGDPRNKPAAPEWDTKEYDGVV